MRIVLIEIHVLFCILQLLYGIESGHCLASYLRERVLVHLLTILKLCFSSRCNTVPKLVGIKILTKGFMLLTQLWQHCHILGFLSVCACMYLFDPSISTRLRRRFQNTIFLFQQDFI